MHAVRNIVAALNRLVHARLPAGARAHAGRAPARRASQAGRMRPPAAVLARVPAPPEESAYAHAGTEPSLDEMLCDPIVQLVIRADRLEPAEVQGVLTAARRSAAAAGPRRPAI
jgi:hypothetical protein